MDDSPYESAEYRLQWYYLLLGVVCLVFFLVMGISSVWAALTNIDGSFKRPILAAWIFGTFWSALVLLCIWVILAYYRELLIIDPTKITQHGIISVKSIALDDVTQVKWGRYSMNGSVLIRDSSTKIKIHLDNFTRTEIEEIKTFVREAVPEEIQTGRAELVAQREKLTSRRRPRSKNAVVTKSLVFLAIGSIFISVWAVEAAPQFLLAGIVNVVFALLLLWNLRRRRKKKGDKMIDETASGE
ncbi:MAG: hypothetical protein WEB58_06225 [Planctomycetaceae bacterium]